jgi:hypothetical protein
MGSFFLQSRKNLSDVASASASLANIGGSASGAVSSVFTRTGAVTAQSGDYTAAQVGADASGAAAAAQAAAIAASVPLSSLPLSGNYLRAPSLYGSSTQMILGVVNTSFQVPSVSTTVAAGSTTGEISLVASWATPSAGVLSVASTTGFASSGTLYVSASGNTVATVTYTGTSGGNTFTGCAYVSGSATGTVATGGTVVQASAAALISTGSFTAPPSGSVVVTVSMIIQYTQTSSSMAWTLFGHGTTTQYGFNINFPTLTTNNRYPVSLTFPVTGLTPGTSYNFDLACACSLGQTASIYAFSSTSSSPTLGAGGNGSPVTMLVQAV